MDPALAFTYDALLLLSPVSPACFASHAKIVVTPVSHSLWAASQRGSEGRKKAA